MSKKPADLHFYMLYISTPIIETISIIYMEATTVILVSYCRSGTYVDLFPSQFSSTYFELITSDFYYTYKHLTILYYFYL